MAWLHSYIPHRECVLHEDRCVYVQLFAKGSKNQGVNELKRDGGWFEFKSHEAAKRHYRTQFEPQGYVLKQECYCLN